MDGLKHPVIYKVFPVLYWECPHCGTRPLDYSARGSKTYVAGGGTYGTRVQTLGCPDCKAAWEWDSNVGSFLEDPKGWVQVRGAGEIITKFDVVLDDE